MAAYETKPVEEQKRASIRDGALILYFDTAETPSVARFDLDSLAQASFEIADKRENSYYITLRDFSGQTRDVARFGTKAEAHQALQAILQALLSHRDAPTRDGSHRKSSGVNGVARFFLQLLKWLGFLVLAILGLYLILFLVAMNRQPVGQARTPVAAHAPADAPLASLPEGRSVDADAILGAAMQEPPAAELTAPTAAPAEQ